MKTRIAVSIVFGCLCAVAAPGPTNKSFDFPTELKYPFLPKQRMTFINGVIKNKDAKALPDIEAKYSNKIRVDNRNFTLPGEICETMSACYKADFNNDGIPDYVFVGVKVWNGRFAGRSDVAVYVSTKKKEYNLSVFETQYLEAVKENGRVMLVKYAYSDDNITLIRSFYGFNNDGTICLCRVEAFPSKSVPVDCAIGLPEDELRMARERLDKFLRNEGRLTQSEMTILSGIELKLAGMECYMIQYRIWNQPGYEKIEKQFMADCERWEKKLRDERAKPSAYAGGSMEPMDLNERMTALVVKRIAELKAKWLVKP